jgi:hypothetical protein
MKCNIVPPFFQVSAGAVGLKTAPRSVELRYGKTGEISTDNRAIAEKRSAPGSHGGVKTSRSYFSINIGISLCRSVKLFHCLADYKFR